MSAWPDDTVYAKKRLHDAVEGFRKTPVKEFLEQAGPLLSNEFEEAFEESVNILGRVDLNVLVQSEAFVDRVEGFLSAAERMVRMQGDRSGGEDPRGLAEEIVSQLDLISTNLQLLTGKEVAT